MAVSTVLVLFAAFTAIVTANDCSTFAPDHESTACRIVSTEGGCYRYEENGQQINQCDYSVPCRVSTGMELQVSCGAEEDGDSSLYLFHGNSTLDGHEALWPFITSDIQGLYECRSDEGSLIANRSVIVDDGVYVIPSNARSYEQVCRRDIVPNSIPGYNCSVALGIHRYTAGSGGRHTVWFNVLGVRPIDVMIEMIWVNHYPVDLDLSWNTEASNSTSLHKVELNSDDLVFIGDDNTVRAYAVITVNNTFQSSTMCVNLQFHGAPILFPGDGMAKEVTTHEGQSADFDCSIRVDNVRLADGALATISFLVQSSESGDLVQCLNCTISTREISSCWEMEEERSCSGLQFFNSSSGVPDMTTHNLTARWNQVDINHNGYEVVCAVAVRGVTQWAHSATLTVLTASTVSPTTPRVTSTTTPRVTSTTTPRVTSTTTPRVSLTSTTTQTSTPRNSTDVNSSRSTQGLTVGATVGVAVGALVVVTTLVSVAVLGLVFLCRRRHRESGRLPMSEEEESETLRPKEKT